MIHVWGENWSFTFAVVVLISPFMAADVVSNNYESLWLFMALIIDFVYVQESINGSFNPNLPRQISGDTKAIKV